MQGITHDSLSAITYWNKTTSHPLECLLNACLCLACCLRDRWPEITVLDGQHNAHRLQRWPDRNVSKTTWQKEIRINFKRPTFEKDIQKALTGTLTSGLVIEEKARPTETNKVHSEWLWRVWIYSQCLLTQGITAATLKEPKGNCWHKWQYIQLYFTPRRMLCNVV